MVSLLSRSQNGKSTYRKSESLLELIQTMPASMFLATRCARLMFCVKIYRTVSNRDLRSGDLESY